MKRKCIAIMLALCAVVTTACGGNSASNLEENSVVSTETEQLSETSEIAETEILKESFIEQEQTTEEEFDVSMPEEFTDYRKFIGKDISFLGIELDENENSGFVYDILESQFLGHKGTISVQYDVQDRIIWSINLNIEDSPLTVEEYDDVCSKVSTIFGTEKKENTISYDFTGLTDFYFRLPKVDKLQMCAIGWNADKCSEFFDNRHKNDNEDTTSESKKAVVDDAELVAQLKGTYTYGDDRYIIYDSRIIEYNKMYDKTNRYSFEIVDFNEERCLFIDFRNSLGRVYVLRDGEVYTHLVDVGEDGNLTLYTAGVKNYDDSSYRHFTRISSECIEIKKPAIGMTADAVRESTWGEPKKVNKTTYSFGVKEQWVYGNGRYIYLEDGIVTAIQE